MLWIFLEEKDLSSVLLILTSFSLLKYFINSLENIMWCILIIIPSPLILKIYPFHPYLSTHTALGFLLLNLLNPICVAHPLLQVRPALEYSWPIKSHIIKEIDSLSPSSCQISIAPQLLVGFQAHCIPNAEILSSLSFHSPL